MQCRNIQGRAPIRLLIQFFLIIPQSLHTWCQIEIRMIPNEWQSHNYWCVDTVKHPLRITNKLHPTHIHIQRCTTNIQLNCSALATIWYTTTYVLILYFDWRLLYKLNKNDAWLKVGRQYSYMFNSILLTLDCHSGWMGWFQYWPGFHSNWNFFFLFPPNNRICYDSTTHRKNYDDLLYFVHFCFTDVMCIDPTLLQIPDGIHFYIMNCVQWEWH